MGQSISTRRWRDLEGRTIEEQKQFFSTWKEKVRRENVSSEQRNVKKGDHLEVHRCGYDHHFICAQIQGEKITVIEYGGPHFELSVSQVLALDVEKLGKVREEEYSFEKLEKEEVMKVLWPKKLKRYNANETVRRARTRIGENSYDLLRNNCEHFVMWCIFGLNVSLQLLTWYKWVMEFVYSSCAGGKACMSQGAGYLVSPLLLKVLADESDEIVRILNQKYATFVIGVVISFPIDVGLFFYELKKTFEQRDSGQLATVKLFNAKLVEIIAKLVLHLGLGATGSAVGLAYSGLIGQLAGGAGGAFVGNIIGALIGWVVRANVVKQD